MKHDPIALMILTMCVVVVVALAITGCADHPTEAPIRTVVEKIPVTAPCPDARPASAAYPDTPAALVAAPDILALAKIYKATVLLLRERTQEDDAQIKACAAQPSPAVPPAG